MGKCNDFIERKVIIQIRKTLTACERCVNHSDKYNDCKLHGANYSTDIVHGEIKRSRR